MNHSGQEAVVEDRITISEGRVMPPAIDERKQEEKEKKEKEETTKTYRVVKRKRKV